MLNRKELILFDLDGTMIDTVPDLAMAIDTMQSSLELPGRSEAKVRNWVGNGIERLVKRALTDDLEAEPEPVLFERALPLFMDAYAERPCDKSRFYPGARETLAYLKNAGYKLGCITNKRGRFTETLLKALGVYYYFGLVLSGDSLPQRKPDPMPLLHAARHFNVAAERSLMVGDSLTDVRAARAAGFQIVCVSYGYNQGRDISEAGPDGIINALTDLLDLLPAPVDSVAA